MLQQRRKRIFDDKEFVLHGVYGSKKQAKKAGERLKEKGYFYRVTGSSKDVEVWVSKYPRFYYR